MAIRYFKLLFDSFRLLPKNIVLLLPYPISWGLFLGLLVLIAFEFVLLIPIFSTAIFYDPTILFLTPGGLFFGVFFGSIDLLLGYGIFVYTQGMTLGMIGDVTYQGSTSVANMFRHGKYFFKKLFILNIIIGPLLFIPIFSIFALYLLSIFFSFPLGISGTLFLFFLSFFWMLIVIFSVLFLRPSLYFERLSTLKVLRFAVAFAWKNFGHASVTILIAALASLLVGMLVTLISTPFVLLSAFSTSDSLIALGNIGGTITSLLGNVIGIFMGIIVTLFIFKSYLAKRSA